MMRKDNSYVKQLFFMIPDCKTELHWNLYDNIYYNFSLPQVLWPPKPGKGLLNENKTNAYFTLCGLQTMPFISLMTLSKAPVLA